MSDIENSPPLKNNATVFLVSGELDKAIAAFDVALGFAAMGVKVDMWFILYGINSIKKPRSFLHRISYLFKILRDAPGRRTETDVCPQRIIPFLNSANSQSLPLSQLNYFGIGRLLVNFVMRHKQSPLLVDMVKEAEDLGINFKICQPCIDILMLDIEEELMVKADVQGVSNYTMNVMESHYNAVF